MLGVAESTLSDLELGKRQAWLKVYKELSRTLSIKEELLLPEEIFGE